MNCGYKVRKFEHLRDKPRQDEARKFLENIAKHVQPIMKRNKWRVQLLSEFYPVERPCLRGQNWGRGKEIKLRLRRPYSDGEFIPCSDALNTMLHELCHNVHPHGPDFDALLNDLRKECQELTNSTWTNGFNSHNSAYYAVPKDNRWSPSLDEDEDDDDGNGSYTFCAFFLFIYSLLLFV